MEAPVIPIIPAVERALHLMSLGYRVMPLAPLAKRPPLGFSWKGQPLHDPDYVRALDAWEPNSGVAILGGSHVKEPPYLYIVDVDRAGSDLAILDRLRTLGELDRLAVVRTGRGGYHLYFRSKTPYRNTTDQTNKPLGHGAVDSRGQGGYVVAPGSVVRDTHEDSPTYGKDLPYTSLGMVDFDEFFDYYETLPAAPMPAFDDLPYIPSSWVVMIQSWAKKATPTVSTTTPRSPEELKKAVASPPRGSTDFDYIDARVAAGKSFAPYGSRDTSVNDYAGKLAADHPVTPPENLAAPFLESFLRMAEESPPDDPAPTFEDFVEKIRSYQKSDAGGLESILLSPFRKEENLRALHSALEGKYRDIGIYLFGGLLAELRAPGETRNEQLDVSSEAAEEGDVDSGSVSILNQNSLDSKLTDAVRYFVLREGDWREATAPTKLIQRFMDSGGWRGIDKITGTTLDFILRPDGTFAGGGYDRFSHLFSFYEGTPPPPLPVEEAKAIIEDMLVDFPFHNPASKAAYLASLFGAVGRTAHGGRLPGLLLDGNALGIGKSTLAQTIARLSQDKTARLITITNDDDRNEKVLLSRAVNDDQVILADNIEQESFGTQVIAALLTSPQFGGRILGETKTWDGEWRPLFIITGNNASLYKDLPRRFLRSRLVWPEEEVAGREYKHEDFEDWVIKDRERLRLAILSLLSAFIKAGKPTNGLKPLGSFEKWSKLARNAVVWLGYEDPLLTQKELVEEAIRVNPHLLLLMLREQFKKPFTAKELAKKAFSPSSKGLDDALIAAYPKMENSRSHLTVGRALASLRDKVSDGLVLKLVSTTGGIKKWKVEKI